MIDGAAIGKGDCLVWLTPSMACSRSQWLIRASATPNRIFFFRVHRANGTKPTRADVERQKVSLEWCWRTTTECIMNLRNSIWSWSEADRQHDGMTIRKKCFWPFKTIKNNNFWLNLTRIFITTHPKRQSGYLWALLIFYVFLIIWFKKKTQDSDKLAKMAVLVEKYL